jgi:hypothetical protein
MQEPGLDLHEWTTRWEQVWEAAEESPADAVGEMDRLVEEMLGERGALEMDDELRKQYDASHELATKYEAGDASAGDLAEAINGFRLIYESVVGSATTEPGEAPS